MSCASLSQFLPSNGDRREEATDVSLALTLQGVEGPSNMTHDLTVHIQEGHSRFIEALKFQVHDHFVYGGTLTDEEPAQHLHCVADRTPPRSVGSLFRNCLL